MDFDLAEVLAALGQRARDCVWRGRNIQYVSRDERDVAAMQSLAEGWEVSGTDLLDGIAQVLQVVDGQFEATVPGGESPSVVIRAIDSSWWEVLSDDAEVQVAIRRRFRVVEEDGSGTA